MEKIKIFECYAGFGGASFALTKANIPYECVGFSEIHTAQIKIYEQNHKGVKNYGDINNIDLGSLPNFDLITGGFPCQDVSMAGLRDLSKGRTNTVFKMLDIIKEKKPKYCLLENVEGVLTALKGELIKEIIRQLKAMGYAVSYKLLYSKDHGTPQNRPRVWIACELDRDSFLFNPFPNKEELNLFVSDLLENNVSKDYYLTKNQAAAIMKKKEHQRFKDLNYRINPIISKTLTTKDPKGQPNDSILIHSKQPRTGKGKGGKGHLFRKDNISYTIDTNNGQFIEINEEYRVLTPKECFRLMGFFNDEINIGGIAKTNLYFSAGNGWDINLVSKIFQKWLANAKR